jgi:hypothetical protein
MNFSILVAVGSEYGSYNLKLAWREGKFSAFLSTQIIVRRESRIKAMWTEWCQV